MSSRSRQGTSHGVTYGAVWELPQNVILGRTQGVIFQRPQDVGRRRPQDVCREHPSALHRGPYGDIHRASFGDVVTSSGHNFAQWVLFIYQYLNVPSPYLLYNFILKMCNDFSSQALCFNFIMEIHQFLLLVLQLY